jgi:hypothetical protein
MMGLAFVLLAASASACVSDERPSIGTSTDAGSRTDVGAFGDDGSAPRGYSVGGVVKGLTATGLTLSNNGEKLNIALGNDGVFTFTNRVASGTKYEVKIETTPSNQACSVQGGSGELGTSNITNVVVTCVTGFGLSVKVTGLTGGWLSLKNTGGGSTDVRPPITQDGSVAFNSVLDGSTYALETGSGMYTCSFDKASGTVAGADVTANATCSRKNGQPLDPSGESLALPIAVTPYHYPVGLIWTGTEYWVAWFDSQNKPADTLMAFNGAFALTRRNTATSPTDLYFTTLGFLNNRAVVTASQPSLLAVGFATTTVDLTPGLAIKPALWSNVVSNAAGDRYFAREGTGLTAWSSSGLLLTSGSAAFLELNLPSGDVRMNNHLAIAGPTGAEVLLTYTDRGLEAWRPSDGTQVAKLQLNGAASDTDGWGSSSFAKGRFWALNAAKTQFLAYDLGAP